MRRLITGLFLLAISGISYAAEPATKPATGPSTRPAIVAKPLSDPVNKGLKWLIDQQRTDGGWSQGEESANMRSSRSPEQTAAGDKSNIADTCMAMMALIRSGQGSPGAPYWPAINGGVGFICESVEKSDKDGLWITEVRNTRTQSKLGTYCDTYLAALVLSEMKAMLPESPTRVRVAAALDKTLAKMQAAHIAEGGINQQGWAVALSEGLCRKAVNRAAAVGANVSMDFVAMNNAGARDQLQVRGSKVDVVAGGDAGVALYSNASNLQSLQEAVNTDRKLEPELRAKLAAPSTNPAERKSIETKLAEIDDNSVKLQQSQKAVIDKMNDPQFVSGFGSNGGEEFLSYWAIGESLVTERDPTFAEWDSKMTGNLNRVQNDDGSWSGHHCITGKTFCTSAALLVLMVDRTTAPAAQAVREGGK